MHIITGRAFSGPTLSYEVIPDRKIILMNLTSDHILILLIELKHLLGKWSNEKGPMIIFWLGQVIYYTLLLVCLRSLGVIY